MAPELEKKLYLDGITLFNEHEFFHAHEVWEDIWHEAYGTKFEFYQGMIQCAVALEHYADFGRFAAFEPLPRQYHALYGVVDFTQEPYAVQFGIGHGFTAVSEPLILKLILTRSF